MFNSCLLLSSNGHVVYSGPQRFALPYMSFLGFYPPPHENVADFLLDVVAGEPGATSGVDDPPVLVTHNMGNGCGRT